MIPSTLTEEAAKDPSKVASPKVKMPPSEATSQ